MVMKGSLQADHVPVNNFELIVVGMPSIFFVTISGIEEELQTVDLPDRTTASGGNTTPVEFTATVPLHHTLERAALESWFKEGQDPVTKTYKKPATLIHKRLSGGEEGVYAILGMFPKMRKLPDLDKNNDGDLAVMEWTFRADDILPG